MAYQARDVAARLVAAIGSGGLCCPVKSMQLLPDHIYICFALRKSGEVVLVSGAEWTGPAGEHCCDISSRKKGVL